MKQHPSIMARGVVSGFAGLILVGCAGIKDSLKLEKTVLVKVPSARIVEGRPSAHGWEFRHVLEAPKDVERRGQWYVAWNTKNPIRTSSVTAYWRTLFARAPELAEATHAALNSYPVLIEPNRTFVRQVSKVQREPEVGETFPSEYGSGTRLVINKLPMKVWADAGRREGGTYVIDPVWHLRREYSQLEAARSRLARPGQGIRIGHLDNGLDGKHPAAPMHLVRDQDRANAVGLLEWAQRKEKRPPVAPEKTGASHGLGTVGILAGSWVAIDEKKVPGGKIAGYYGWLGGAPHATVVPVRVAPWVFSMTTGELAYAIDYASRRQKCDVLTMSHGGAPTQAWVDAINAAYERGTAMFAAESDYFSIVPDPLRPRGLFLPASPVYPAAFRRVVGVTGVTADYRSYGRNTLPRLLRAPGQMLKWMARGSFGADGTSTVLFRPSRKADPSQIRRQGELRPHPIAAYSPNIPWLSVRTDETGRRIADGLDLDGAGTSASTPQVAAAAALWLQKNRAQIPADVWEGKRDGWKKAEAVYYALIKTADRRGKNRADPYLGAGLLRADDALTLSYRQIQREQMPEPLKRMPVWERDVPKGSLYFEQAGNDYFDGARSFWSVFGLHSIRHVKPHERARLEQQPLAGKGRAAELGQLYYNMMLLREWHGGDTPNGKRHARIYKKRAERKAIAALRRP